MSRKAARNLLIRSTVAGGCSMADLADLFQVSRARVYQVVRPAKQRARMLAHLAEKRGDIVGPDACESCGGDGPLEKHHHDYAKPLDVHWLCRKCHAAEHAGPTKRARGWSREYERFVDEIQTVQDPVRQLVAEQRGHQPERPRRVTICVTDAEKKAVRVVALARGSTESDLLRAKPIAEVVLEYERIRAALGKAA